MSEKRKEKAVPEMSHPEEDLGIQSGTGKKPGSPVPSCVSMKSNQSKDPPHNFREQELPTQESGTRKKPGSPVPCCVSMKSNQSKDPPQNFREQELPTQESSTRKKPHSPVPSCVSMKSNQSKDLPQNFREQELPTQESGTRSLSVPSCVSLKSNQSKDPPHNFRQKEILTQKRDNKKIPGSSSCVSMKSAQSKDPPHNFREEELLSQIRVSYETEESDSHDQEGFRKFKDHLFHVFSELELKMIVFIKHELERFKKLLRKEKTRYYENVTDEWCGAKEGVLNIALHFLRKMKEENLADELETNELIVIRQCELKSDMKMKYETIIEGIAQRGESKLLNDIYTDLYITESGKTGDEHESKIVEAAKNQETSETPIKCNDMFKRLTGQGKPIRTMITQGIAGIGKSVSVQKFILEWAKGNGNQDIKFIFPLPFRELNLKKGKHSLMDILNQFFPETKGLKFREKYKVMFVFDGLDECHLPFKFKTNESCSDATKQASLDVLMTNLIKGNMLPSALIWITTRPAASAKIPAEFVDCVTELRGFNNEQKMDYFKKRISDENLANKIIDHISGSRVLHTMCHIPVFCWISATVLEQMLKGKKSEDTPKTLTQMYISFLIFQTMQKSHKYDDDDERASDIPWDKRGFLALGKLAFEHLKKNNFVFYSHDMRSCGIGINDISVYSGVCTQETGMFLGTTYSFMHLSIQEFIAALYAYVCADNDKMNVFLDQNEAQANENEPMIDLLKTAVDKAMEYDNGHLDLFLRFLLGLSLESNQQLIRGLLTQKAGSSHSQKEIVDYIKAKFDKESSAEKTVNLFHCLNEMNDRSLVRDMQSQIKEGKLSMTELSAAQWSALLYILLTSDEDLDVFDLNKFLRSEECLRKLLPVVEIATKAWLNECNLSERSCMDLVKILSSVSSKLTELDMSNNTLQDSGVKHLSEGMKSPNCKLETLRLNNCGLTEEICSVMATVVSLESCTLKELELGENSLQDSGVKQLMVALESPHCQLKILRLSKCCLTEEGCAAVASALKANPSLLLELDLTGNKVGDLGVKQLSAVLENSYCKLETLKLSDCSITGEGYVSLASAVKSNSCLTELDLRGNDPGDEGVKMLTDLVEDQCSKFKTLRLLRSPDAVEACNSISKLLKGNPLLLRELDLNAKLQNSSIVKKLPALLEDSHCRLQILRLNNNKISEEDCCTLVSALNSNPSHLRELDLSLNKLGTSALKQLCSLLENPNCKLQKLGLNSCFITEEGYAVMVPTLGKNTSHLEELDLGGNKTEASGCEYLCALLNNSNCNLTKLELPNCDIKEEGYKALALALRSNPSSRLTELDLGGNYPGKSGVKMLTDLQNDPNCKLKKLRLLSSAAEKACSTLAKVLGTDPLLMTQMDLSKKIKNCDVKMLCDLLQDSHCTLQVLNLSDCCIKEDGYKHLASALRANSSSHLMELDLRGNDPGKSGVKLLTDLQNDPNCKLEKLRLLKCPAADEALATLAMGENPLLHTELKLSRNTAGLSGDSRLMKLCDIMQDSHCKLYALQIINDDLTEKSCITLATVLSSKSCCLRQLDLSQNRLQDGGVRQLCKGLKICKLQILRLASCGITGVGYCDLASALKSSKLEELDLRGNDPGYDGVKLVTDASKGLIYNTALRFLKSPDAQEAYNALGKQCLLEPELNLSKTTPSTIKVKQLAALLEDSHCRPQKLTLYKTSSISDGDIACLFSSLILNPSHLRQLNLNSNKLAKPGLNKLCELIRKPYCILEELELSDCITEEACADLMSALCENPSHIKQLNLSRNILGDLGMKKISLLLENQKCRLVKLMLNNCDIGKKGCASLTDALRQNPSHLRELDLRGNNQLGDSVEQLREILKGSGCKLWLDGKKS